MVQAALGGEFEVPTIDGGKTRVKVPEGTQSGRRFRLQGKGMPVLRSRQVGDMYVQVVVETPQKLTKKQRDLLAEFERLSSRDTHPESAGFFGKVKDLLSRLDSRPAHWRLTAGSLPPYPISGRNVGENLGDWWLCSCEACKTLERQIGRQLRFIELREARSSAASIGGCATSSRRSLHRFDDEFRFLRTWLEKPLAVGAVAPSGKALARIMAGYIDPAVRRPRRRARSRHRPGHRSFGRAWHRSCPPDPGRIRSAILRALARALSRRHRGAGRRLQPTPDAGRVLRTQAAAFVSGLPLFNKPLKMRLDLLDQAFGLMQPDAPFVQFTYNAISPIPRSHGGLRSEASARVWRNFPPRACLGLSAELTAEDRRRKSAYSVLCRPSSVVRIPMAQPKILVFPARSAASRTMRGWRRWRPRS